MSNTVDPKVPYLASFEARQKQHASFLTALQALQQSAFPKGEVITDYKRLSRRYSADESGYTRSVPLAAVAPVDTQTVSLVVKLCAQHRVTVVARGAGTGLEGGCIPYCGGVVLDTRLLLGIHIDKGNQLAWVGAGVRKLALLRAAEAAGFTFGPDPSSNPCLGGMVSTSGSGMSTLKYGTMRENVLSLTVVTPDGGIIERTRQPVRKSSAGLELTQLFIGSEGTLGVVCAVCVRLFPLETYSAGALASFDTLQDAVRSVVALRSAGVPSTLLRCELLSKDAVVGTNALCVKENKSDAQIPVCPTLLLEFVATNMRDIHRDFKVVAGIIKKVGNLKKHAAIRFAKKGPKMDALWSARRRCGIAAMKYVGTATCITTDVCVPLTALANCIVDTEKEFANYQSKEDGTTQSIPCIICAHISDGNFHVVIPYKNEKEMRVAKDLETSLVRRAIACGGTISGEHGVGIGKVRHVVEEHGDVHVDVQESIKKSLDPCNNMNPAGKVYPSQLTLFPAAHL